MKSLRLSLYFINVVATGLLLPILSIGCEYFLHDKPLTIHTIGIWFVFWAVGIRLLIAGIRQISKPAFTASIFSISSSESYPIIRELGFANVTMGITASLSLFYTSFYVPGLLLGLLYFGLAGFMHVSKKAASFNEGVALVSDLYVFIVCMGLLATGIISS